MHNHAPPGYDCPVCRFVAGGEADFVAVTENERALAVVSQRVWAKGPGHVLVMPKQHYENLYELEDEAALDIHRLARRIAIAFKDALGCDGTSTRQHNEPAGNQDLWHLHLHVFPRYDGDELSGSGFRTATLDERHALAERLRAVL